MKISVYESRKHGGDTLTAEKVFSVYAVLSRILSDFFLVS